MAKERPVFSGRKSGNARGRQATTDFPRAAGNPQTPGPRRPTSGGPSDPRPIPGPFIPRPASPGDEDENPGALPSDGAGQDTKVANPAEATTTATAEPGAYLTALGTAHVLTRDDSPSGSQNAVHQTDQGGLHPGGQTDLHPDDRGGLQPGGRTDLHPDDQGVGQPDDQGGSRSDGGHDTTAASASVGAEQEIAAETVGDETTGPLSTTDPDGSMTESAAHPSPQSPAGQRAAYQHDAEQAALRRAETVGIAKVPPPRPQVPGLQLQPLVHVGDMAASVAFYERLGGELIHGDRDDEWVLMQVGTAQIGLVTRPPDASRGESTVELNFAATMPLDRLEQLLSDHDLQVVKVARDLDLGTQLHIETPDGMPIKIHQVEPDLLV